MSKAPRHAEVNQQRATGFEPKNQILAAPLDRLDAFPLELARDGERLERPDEARVQDVDPVEPPTGQDGRERRPDGLHLGQLGHASSLVAWTTRASRARSAASAEARRRACT